MNVKKLGIGVLAVASAWAIPAYAAPGMTTPALLTAINARDLGFQFYIPNTSNPMGCSNPTTFRIAPSMSNYNAMVSTILTAFTAQKTISVYVYTCDTDGVSLIAAAQMQ
ncbi:hypothetical protein [Caulobacter sp. LARHSG274]